MRYRELFYWQELVGFSIPLGFGCFFYLSSDCEVRSILTGMMVLAFLWTTIPLLKKVREYEYKERQRQNAG